MHRSFRTLAAAAICLSLAADSSACLWIHGTTIDGHWDRREGEYPSLNETMKDNVLERSGLFSRHYYKPDNPVAEANDAAVQTLLKGDANKAVAMLRQIEANNPGIYFTAANLGTALELSGNDEEALWWIKEGIRRNPDSHMRTEWLHVKILETKIRLKTDPAWLENHMITGIDLARIADRDYRIDSAQGPMHMPAVRGSLFEQLSVRMLLVKPSDPIVAQLILELAHLESRYAFQEQAIEYLNLAETYGMPAQKTQALRSKAEQLIAGAKREKQLFGRIGYPPATLRAIASAAFVFAFAAGLGGIAWLIVLRRRKRRSVQQG